VEEHGIDADAKRTAPGIDGLLQKAWTLAEKVYDEPTLLCEAAHVTPGRSERL
jgi:hypothetical protein